MQSFAQFGFFLLLSTGPGHKHGLVLGLILHDLYVILHKYLKTSVIILKYN